MFILGSLIFNPTNALLIFYFGWRVAFRINSFVVLITGISCSFLFKDEYINVNQERYEICENEPLIYESMSRPSIFHGPNEETESSLEIDRKLNLNILLKKPEIILWLLASLISYLTFYMPFLNFAYYMKLKGIPTTKSSFALTMLSFAECVNYILASFYGDNLKRKLILVNIISTGALSVIFVLWPLIDVNYAVILINSMIMGGFIGLTIVYSYAESAEITELRPDIAWSYTNLCSGIGILLGPICSANDNNCPGRTIKCLKCVIQNLAEDVSTIKVNIDNRDIKIIVDTGSEVTVIQLANEDHGQGTAVMEEELKKFKFDIQ
ncbi:hypothetical protein A3Q56_00768 [Intoshia linei]|uniref:Major facilitator superfamily (MFS) profile domain-containing protein n=1 Tax=Intoshia linei TaxID=1819745 RepID=A0A177BAV5_9BILA|nr:hypothetical protein A3Q56_00768 [Intoshia linei]